jgi:hypothetical protein
MHYCDVKYKKNVGYNLELNKIGSEVFILRSFFPKFFDFFFKFKDLKVKIFNHFQQ